MASETPSYQRLDQSYDPLQPCFQDSHGWSLSSTTKLDSKVLGTGRHGWSLGTIHRVNSSSSQLCRYPKGGGYKEHKSLKPSRISPLLIDSKEGDRQQEGDFSRIRPNNSSTHEPYEPTEAPSVYNISRDWSENLPTLNIRDNRKVEGTVVSPTRTRIRDPSESSRDVSDWVNGSETRGEFDERLNLTEELQSTSLVLNVQGTTEVQQEQHTSAALVHQIRAGVTAERKSVKENSVDGGECSPTVVVNSEELKFGSTTVKPLESLTSQKLHEDKGSTRDDQGDSYEQGHDSGDGWFYGNAYNTLSGPYKIEVLLQALSIGYLPGELHVFHRQGGNYLGPYELRTMSKKLLGDDLQQPQSPNPLPSQQVTMSQVL